MAILLLSKNYTDPYDFCLVSHPYSASAICPCFGYFRKPFIMLKYNYNVFVNHEAQEILNRFEEEMGCSIMRTGNTIYLIPDSGNSFLGFRSKDFREWIGANARLSDVYLSYYISMFIFYLFYGGRNKNPKQREFLRIETLIDELDRRFDIILKSDREGMEKLEDQYSINFIRIAENLDSKKGYEENKRTTKYGTAIRICRLLEQEKLIRLVDDDSKSKSERLKNNIEEYDNLEGLVKEAFRRQSLIFEMRFDPEKTRKELNEIIAGLKKRYTTRNVK